MTTFPYALVFYANRLLDNYDRENLKPIVKRMEEVVPAMMARKIPEANVQQASIVDIVTSTDEFKKAKILCVGCFEDTAFEYLKLMGYNIVGIDPELNFSLHEFRMKYPDEKFDLIFSISVLEHVKDDREFIIDLCSMLNMGGFLYLTCDFKEDFHPGDALPYTDIRFYTTYTLHGILNLAMSRQCIKIGDRIAWGGSPDFHYQGHNYNFATLGVMKWA